MNGHVKQWGTEVDRHFAYLGEYGFRLDHVEDKWWATRAVYLSPRLGLEIVRSVEFRRVEIELLRLVNGEAPEVQVWVTDRPIDRVLLDNVVEARAPDLLAYVPGGLSRGAVKKQLRWYAELLPSLVPDFLAGGDAALVEAERVIRARVAGSPQELTIWLPSDASPAEEAAARAEAERTTPSSVQVVVKRYDR